MPLNIKDEHTDRLARELAQATGESLTTAVRTAVEERLARVGNDERRQRRISQDLDELVERVARRPVLDGRTADEIIGYDEHGVPR